MPHPRETVRRLILDQRGASALEYVVLASLIIAILVVVIAILGGATRDNFSSFTNTFLSLFK